MTPESTTWLLEHAASAYAEEIKNEERIRDRANSALSLMIVPSFGIAAYLASSNLKGEVFTCWNVILFWMPWLVSVVFLLGAARYMYDLLCVAYESVRIPSPGEVVTYVEQHPRPSAALQEAHRGLLEEYTKSVHYNVHKNNQRKVKLLRVQWFAFFSFAVLLLCIPRWAYNTYNAMESDKKTQSIKIVSPIPVQLLPGATNVNTTAK